MDLEKFIEETLLEIAHQPACFLQMLRQQCRLAVTRLTEVVGVLLIDTNTRIDCGVDAHHPALFFLPHDDVGQMAEFTNRPADMD